jgi:hypothetical protein
MSSLRLEVIFDGVADKPPGTANRPAGQLDECIALWLLKNSSAGRGLKLRRVRMPYKRFSRVA